MSVAALPIERAAAWRDLQREIAGHRWVRDVRITAPRVRVGAARARVLVALNEAGVAALRAQGKATMVREWQRLLSLDEDLTEWRLTAALGPDRTEDDYLHSRPDVRSIERVGSGAARVFLQVPLDLRVFEGHFASVPLVPGMLQVAWALELARKALPGTGGFRGLEAAKFRCLVRPGMELALQLERPEASDTLHFEYRHGDRAVSLGRLSVSRDA